MIDSRSSDPYGWLGLAWVSLRRLLGVVRAHHGLFLFTLTLLAIDLLSVVYFAVADVLDGLDFSSVLNDHKELLITTDGGIPEWFSYFKTLLIVILIARVARSTRQPMYLALAVLFLVVLLDDAMEIHESAGEYLARTFHIPPLLGLRPRDVGEMLTWAILGTLVAPLLVFGLVRADRKHRADGLAFLLPFGALAFSAIVLDQLYWSGNFAKSSAWSGALMTVAEDGGEMIALTAACALALGAERETRDVVAGGRGWPNRPSEV